MLLTRPVELITPALGNTLLCPAATWMSSQNQSQHNQKGALKAKCNNGKQTAVNHVDFFLFNLSKATPFLREICYSNGVQERIMMITPSLG